MYKFTPDEADFDKALKRLEQEVETVRKAWAEGYWPSADQMDRLRGAHGGAQAAFEGK